MAAGAHPETVFPRSLRSLAADDASPSVLAVSLVAVLLAAWLGWFLLARVALYEVTDNARIEAAATAHLVQARVMGRVVATRLDIGRDVRAGEILVELDPEVEQFRLEEARRRLESAKAQAAVANDLAGRTDRLFARNLIAQVDVVRAREEARWRRSSVDEHVAAIARLEQEVERRRIRAPVDGRLGEVATLRIGAVVREGDRVASVVPAGGLRAIADFPPAALGRVAVGQPARLRLKGFPWGEYGSLPATVTNVAGELRDGQVRAELTLDPERPALIPLQHGLPGTAEVEVERVTPAALVLRLSGRLVGAAPDASTAAGRR
jgi:RND family efflux transporter MFP subunit